MSEIEWTDRTWNPIRGCDPASPGCDNCYAARMAARGLPELNSPTTGQPFAIMTDHGPEWTGQVEVIESRLDEPLRWKKPRKIFVNSMSDLFHKDVSEETIHRVFDVMHRAPQHTFQILTKRAERLRRLAPSLPWGPHIWAGVSVESEAYAWRMRDLLTVPANRFVSYEPALGPVDFEPYLDGLDWVIVGGESGPGARPFDLAWASLSSYLASLPSYSVPVFVKQIGANAWLDGKRYRTKHKKGGDPAEWPEWLRVREFPEGMK